MGLYFSILFPSPALLPSWLYLGIQEKISAHNRDAESHDHQNGEDQKHKSKHVVNLIGPEGRKDEVHLDKNGAKG